MHVNVVNFFTRNLMFKFVLFLFVYCILPFCWIEIIIKFRLSRRRREVYSGHARLCLSVCSWPHSHASARTRM